MSFGGLHRLVAIPWVHHSIHMGGWFMTAAVDPGPGGERRGAAPHVLASPVARGEVRS